MTICNMYNIIICGLATYCFPSLTEVMSYAESEQVLASKLELVFSCTLSILYQLYSGSKCTHLCFPTVPFIPALCIIKKRNCSLQAISHFPTVFSKHFYCNLAVPSKKESTPEETWKTMKIRQHKISSLILLLHSLTDFFPRF